MRTHFEDPTVDGPEVSAEDHAVAEAARRRRDVGAAVRHVRLVRRIPIPRLSAVTGIPECVVEDLEAGRPVDVGTAVLVAEALGLEVVSVMSRLAQNSTETAPQADEDARYPSPLD